MAKPIVTDVLWEVIEPLLPEEPPKLKRGRPRIDDRAALSGLIFVLKSGIPWEILLQEMSCGWLLSSLRPPWQKSLSGS